MYRFQFYRISVVRLDPMEMYEILAHSARATQITRL